MEAIKKYFPNLSDKQYDQLELLGELYVEWNEKVNLVSRKDIQNIYSHHILHALSIRYIIQFKAGSAILDLGTGGGLPGLPLAIAFPDCDFHLVDARNKKITVVQDIINRLSLTNARATHARVEDVKATYDFIISRAVAPVKTLLTWTHNKLNHQQKNAIPNGYILLKGGDLNQELREARVKNIADIYDLNDYFSEAYYEEKKIVYIPGE